MTLLLADLASLWSSPDCVNFSLGGGGGVHHPASWASERGILCLEVTWSDTFYFWFRWILSCCPLWTTWVLGASVSWAMYCWPFPRHCPPFACPIGLVGCLCQASIFGAIHGPDPLPVDISEVPTALPWWRTCLARLCRPIFFGVPCSLALLWRACFNLSFLERPLCWGILVIMWTTWSWPPHVYKVCFLTLFIELVLGGILVLIKALTELGRIDFPNLGIYSDRQNGYLYQRSCLNPILLLF